MTKISPRILDFVDTLVALPSPTELPLIFIGCVDGLNLRNLLNTINAQCVDGHLLLNTEHMVIGNYLDCGADVIWQLVPPMVALPSDEKRHHTSDNGCVIIFANTVV